MTSKLINPLPRAGRLPAVEQWYGGRRNSPKAGAAICCGTGPGVNRNQGPSGLGNHGRLSRRDGTTTVRTMASCGRAYSSATPAHRRMEPFRYAVRAGTDCVGVARPVLVSLGVVCDGTGAHSTDVAAALGRALACRRRWGGCEFLGDRDGGQRADDYWSQPRDVSCFPSCAGSMPSSGGFVACGRFHVRAIDGTKSVACAPPGAGSRVFGQWSAGMHYPTGGTVAPHGTAV